MLAAGKTSTLLARTTKAGRADDRQRTGVHENKNAPGTDSNVHGMPDSRVPVVATLGLTLFFSLVWLLCVSKFSLSPLGTPSCLRAPIQCCRWSVYRLCACRSCTRCAREERNSGSCVINVKQAQEAGRLETHVVCTQSLTRQKVTPAVANIC